MKYRCEYCGDQSIRSLHRKEAICTKCGGNLLADPQQLKAGNRKVSILASILVVLIIGLIYFGI